MPIPPKPDCNFCQFSVHHAASTLLLIHLPDFATVWFTEQKTEQSVARSNVTIRRKSSLFNHCCEKRLSLSPGFFLRSFPCESVVRYSILLSVSKQL